MAQERKLCYLNITKLSKKYKLLCYILYICILDNFDNLNICLTILTSFWQFWPFLQLFTILTILTFFWQFLQFLTVFDNFWQLTTIFTIQTISFAILTIEKTILETCDIWDTDYNSDNWEPKFMTIFVTWQLIVTLDSIRNSCDVSTTSRNESKNIDICYSVEIGINWYLVIG